MNSMSFTTTTKTEPSQNSPMYKRPMAHGSGTPAPTRQQQLSTDLGLDYDGANGYGSLSSADEEEDMAVDDSAHNVSSVRYQAVKRQMKQLEKEKDNLLLKISRLKEKTKQYEKQLTKEEMDRRNQLNIMKNTHEQAFSEKNKTINLYQSIVREQECELEELRKCTHSSLGTCVDIPSTQNGVAVTRLTTHLQQVTEEKNDILAQFFSQQSLIKQQQSELKGLLRCKSENIDLQAHISKLNKTIGMLSKQSDAAKAKASHGEEEIEALKSQLVDLKENTERKSALVKLEENNTKLQDKLLRKEAEYAEMDHEHRQQRMFLTNQCTDKDRQIRQLHLELLQQKSQPAVERIMEVPVESEASKKHLALLQSEVKELTDKITKLKDEHRCLVDGLQDEHKGELAKLEGQLAAARKDNEELISSKKSKHKEDEQVKEAHSSAIKNLERKVKEKETELSKLRQAMANKVVELQQERDAELEDLERRLKMSNKDSAEEIECLKRDLSLVSPQVTQLRSDCSKLKSVCQSLQQLHVEQCRDASQQISKAIRDVSENNKDLVRKYRKEMALRKKYHNELVELKGNIRVFCRIRPTIKEDGLSPHVVLSVDNDDEDVLLVENSKGRSQSFDVDRLFTPGVTQQKVFSEVEALVTSCVDGYHVCIFAYGQTGSGKTYTMEGVRTDPGINQRALSKLFEEAEDRSKDWTFNIQVSVLEIYNESVRDLLSSDPSDKLDIKLNQEGNLHVPGLSWVTVTNVDDVNKTFSIGHRTRATASTNMNEHSSRSHALLCVEVTGVNRTTGAKTLGKLNLVDLAGSERVSKSGADGTRLKEAQAINKSLSALGDVIAALRSKQSFVPYRNSKLTYLLQDSLGGDSKVLMIVQVAPIERHVNETLCSLNFAQRVKSVELGAASRRTENAEISALKGRLAHYEGSSTPTKSGTPYGTPSKRK